MLTAIPAVPGLIFFTLFAVFDYPVVGLVFVAIVLLPISVLGAWSDFALMTMRAHVLLEADYSGWKGRHGAHAVGEPTGRSSQ